MLAVLLILVVGVDIDALVKELGNDSYQVREKAQKELEKIIDFKVYKQLCGTKETDPEILKRLRYIRNYCEAKLSSQYNVDLGGYPGYPFIDSLPDGYKWLGLEKIDLIIIYTTVASLYGAPSDGSPYWTDYRKATELWIKERIKRVIETAENEEEYREKMKEAMESIQKDVEVMIEGDYRYYESSQMENPFAQAHKRNMKKVP